MLVPVLLFIVGLLFLIKGGDWFVDGASALARRFHLPELLIGATVVSIGTTLPEVMVSTMSAVSGHGEIAYGKRIGSPINFVLVLVSDRFEVPSKTCITALSPEISITRPILFSPLSRVTVTISS